MNCCDNAADQEIGKVQVCRACFLQAKYIGKAKCDACGLNSDVAQVGKCIICLSCFLLLKRY